MKGKDGKMECKDKKAEAKPAGSSTSCPTASVANMVARIRWGRWSLSE